MEILKGFSFDLQRFADAVDLRGNVKVILSAGQEQEKSITELTSDYTIATDGTLIVSGSWDTWAAGRTKAGDIPAVWYRHALILTLVQAVTPGIIIGGYPSQVTDNADSPTTIFINSIETTLEKGCQLNINGSSQVTGLTKNLTLKTESANLEFATSGALGGKVVYNSDEVGFPSAFAGTVSVSNGKFNITGLAAEGESVTIKQGGYTATLTVISGGCVKRTSTETSEVTYWKALEETVFTYDGGNSGVGAMPINTNETTTGTKYFNALGISSESKSEDTVATLNADKNPKTLEVTDKLTGGVNATGDTVTVKDSGTETVYTLADGVTVTAKSASFTTTNGTVSAVTGPLTVTAGTMITKTGNVKYALAEGGAVAFQQGNSVDTSVTTTTGTITLKENNNINDTTIASNGNITGVDGNAEVKGALNGSTIATTGSGTLTINGVSWTVDRDSDGATFTVDTSTKGKIRQVEGLDNDATISTTANVSGLNLFGCTLDSARDGVKYTAGNPGIFDFAYAGASITVKGYTYKLKELSDRISIDTDGTITGLTAGEKVIVTDNNGATFTYEVSGETLLINKTDGTGATIATNRLAEGETDGFIILQGHIEAVNRSTDSSVVQTEVGLEVSQNGIDSVTSGMLLDRNGQATNAENKAVATVTINSDDTLKYQAKEDKAQEVKVLAKSKKTWDITASGKNDTIEYAGSGEAVITAGAGNDKISITGAGAVEVNGVSGRNTIIHTGSGDATLKGGTGKDTLQSYNANDVLTGGEGEDIFILTGVESHVTDFAYGTDKAIVTSATGALDVSKIKANSEGIISYTGNGSTGGSLNVEEQGYGDFYAVNLTDANGNNKVNVAWTGANGGMIDASSLKDRLLLLGNSDGSNDTLIGGQSKDTIVAGKGDSSLWGGAGNDLIESNGDGSNTIFFLAGDGSDTVKGFTPYEDSSSGNADTLNFGGQGITGVKNTSDGIQIYHGNDKLTLAGDYTANTMIQWESGDAKGILKVGKQGEKNNFTYHEDVNYYLGSNGIDTLEIGAGDGDVSIWLSGSQGTYYSSVEIVDASKATGIAMLVGDSATNIIYGGKGANLLWGGTGSAADALYAGSGYNVFYYGKDEGNDIIVNTKADDEVMLYNMTLGDLRGAFIASNQITLIQQNGQKLTINGKAHEFTFADGSIWSADLKSGTWSRVK